MSTTDLLRSLSRGLGTQLNGEVVPLHMVLKFKVHEILASVKYNKKDCHNKKRVYSVGLPRSGTHSVANILSSHLSVAHEPLHQETIFHLCKWKNGVYTDRRIEKILKHRDSRLNIDGESSHFLHHVVDIVQNISCNSRFILTIREPLSWVESEFNQNILSQGYPFWSCLERQRYSKYNNEYDNDALKFIPGVYPIKSYLDYYYDHIQKVVKNVPNEKLMVVNTFSISDKKKDILEFAGVEGEVGTINKDHSNKRSKKLSIYKLVRKKEILDIILSHKCINMLKNKYPFILKDVDYM